MDVRAGSIGEEIVAASTRLPRCCILENHTKRMHVMVDSQVSSYRPVTTLRCDWL